MRRALLIHNPEASSVSPRVRDVIARALAAEIPLEVAETKRRHHATHLARGAVHEDFDVVVCLGGDGTLNEVVNGLIGSQAAVVPLPGGGTNVFARTVGLPNDPIDATAVILERLAARAPARRINLGIVNGRAFAFCAGVGLDAAIVRAVERRFRIKRRIGQPYFVVQGLRTFFFGFRRRDDGITLMDGREVDGLHSVVVCNSDPYTYLGERPFRLCPDARPDGDLDLLALRTMATTTVLRVIFSGFGSARHGRLNSVVAGHDVGSFRLECDRPLPYQVDGDYAGEEDTFVFESARGALSVLA